MEVVKEPLRRPIQFVPVKILRRYKYEHAQYLGSEKQKQAQLKNDNPMLSIYN